MSNNDKEKFTQSQDSARYIKTTKTKSAKKFGRFNAIDALLILIILAAITISVMYFIPEIASDFTSGNDVKITYVIEFRGVDSDFVTKIKSNDIVYEAGKNYKYGIVKAVENDNYNTLIYNDTSGVAELKPHPELRNIIVTVECDATYIEGRGYTINGERIAVGKQYNLRFPTFAGSGYCVDVKISDAQ